MIIMHQVLFWLFETHTNPHDCTVKYHYSHFTHQKKDINTPKITQWVIHSESTTQVACTLTPPPRTHIGTKTGTFMGSQSVPEIWTIRST